MKKQSRKYVNLNESLFIQLYFALKPLYIFKSGSIQICDIVLLLGLIYIIVKYKGKFVVPKRIVKPILIFGLLVFYQTIINILFTEITESVLIVSSLFHIFNFLAFIEFILIFMLTSLDEFKSAIINGITIGLITSCIGLLFFSSSVRQTGFFNNPNQLGYYAVIAFSFTLALKESISIKTRYFLYALSLWAVIASGSKAGFISLIIMLLIYMIYERKGNNVSKLLLQIIGIIFAVGVLYSFLFISNSYVESNQRLLFMRNRILSMQMERDSNLGEGRGYNRIAEIGINSIWGVGEGANDRFETLQGFEIHSSYATMIVSYGLIGFLILSLFVLNCIFFKGVFYRNMILISGILLYSITHNGLRNTMAWMFIGLLLCESYTVYASNRCWKNYKH